MSDVRATSDSQPATSGVGLRPTPVPVDRDVNASSDPTHVDELVSLPIPIPRPYTTASKPKNLGGAWAYIHIRYLLMFTKAQLPLWTGELDDVFMDPIVDNIRRVSPNFRKDAKSCRFKLRSLALGLEQGVTTTQTELRMIDEFNLRDRLCDMFGWTLHPYLSEASSSRKRSRDEVAREHSDPSEALAKRHCSGAATAEAPPLSNGTPALSTAIDGTTQAPSSAPRDPTAPRSSPSPIPANITLRDLIEWHQQQQRSQDIINRPLHQLPQLQLITSAALPIVPTSSSGTSITAPVTAPVRAAASLPLISISEGAPPMLPHQTAIEPTTEGSASSLEYSKLAFPIYRELRGKLAAAHRILFDAQALTNQLMGVSPMAPSIEKEHIATLAKQVCSHYLSLGKEVDTTQHHIFRHRRDLLRAARDGSDK